VARHPPCIAAGFDHIGHSVWASPFQLEFDFSRHVLRASPDDGSSNEIALFPRSVAQFYADVRRALSELGIDVHIFEMPNEIPEPIRFSEDRLHGSYDPIYAQRLWQILRQVNRVFYEFRTGFIGKCGPVHFFWGSFAYGPRS
jgi:Family of unknown function (DUF5996)